MTLNPSERNIRKYYEGSMDKYEPEGETEILHKVPHDKKDPWGDQGDD